MISPVGISWILSSIIVPVFFPSLSSSSFRDSRVGLVLFVSLTLKQECQRKSTAPFPSGLWVNPLVWQGENVLRR